MAHSFDEIREKFTDKMKEKDFFENLYSGIHTSENISPIDLYDILSNLTPLYTDEMCDNDDVTIGMQLFTLGKDGVISLIEITAEESENGTPTLLISLSDIEIIAEDLFKEEK